MKNILLFSALILLLFSACQPEDFPTVDPPKRTLKSLTNINGDEILDFTYEKGLIDSIILHRSSSKFKVFYTDGQVTGMRKSVRRSPADTLVYEDYSFEYGAENIIVRHTQETGRGERFEHIQTFIMNEAGNRVDGMRQDGIEYIPGRPEKFWPGDRWEYTWDEEGKNIIEEKHYAFPFNAPGPRVLLATINYTYDNNPNPYVGLMRPFFPGFNFSSSYLNENNIKRLEITVTDNPVLNRSLEYAYTYGEKGFPEMYTGTAIPGTEFTHLLGYE